MSGWRKFLLEVWDELRPYLKTRLVEDGKFVITLGELWAVAWLAELGSGHLWSVVIAERIHAALTILAGALTGAKLLRLSLPICRGKGKRSIKRSPRRPVVPPNVRRKSRR